MYIKLGLFINGNWKYNSEKYSDVINPADESILGKLPHASEDDLNEAVESSSAGFKVWRDISPEEKGDFLIKVAEKLKEKKDQMSKIMTLEQGKITLEASLEIDRAIDTFQYNGEKAKKFKTKIAELLTLREKSSFVSSRVKQDINMIKSFYRHQGFYFVEIDVQIETLEKNKVNIVYEIEKGEKVTIEYIDWDGHSDYPPK